MRITINQRLSVMTEQERKVYLQKIDEDYKKNRDRFQQELKLCGGRFIGGCVMTAPQVKEKQ